MKLYVFRNEGDHWWYFLAIEFLARRSGLKLRRSSGSCEGRQNKQNQPSFLLLLLAASHFSWRGNSVVQVLTGCTTGLSRWQLALASLLHLFSFWGPRLPSAALAKKPDCKQLYCQQDLHCRYSLHESERPCGALAHIIWHSSLNVQEKASSDSDGCISNKGSAIQGCSRT